MPRHSNSLVESHTVAEIDLSAFRSNVLALRERVDKSIFLAVIKTNAYGHGIVPIAMEAVKAGANRLGVTTVEEGALLRESGIHVPIHVLSTITTDQADDLVYYHLIASISSERTAKAISTSAVKQNRDAIVHLKINTGLHRFGIEPEQAIDFCHLTYHLPNLYWEGIYTHFSNADEGDWDTTEDQFHLFCETVKTLEGKGFYFSLKHVGASTIAIERKDMHLDMVRPGIALFGYQPDIRQKKLISLKPVMKLKTELVHIRLLPANSKVGYGGDYITNDIENIAILPIGHGDGYKRRLSNNGYVLVRGQRVKIVGTIALDQTFINVTNIPGVQEGDEVILIGNQGSEQISARDVANWINSNVDEVLASLMNRIRRIYIS
ncbi:alanine racemase [Oceanobacillus halophilus]|uniref:Alanine racemase n=1 Tax=Oceanobacillus halophilus TaxID=930130 RepID=A0A494ZWQ3_9BACI|nr:alanine racemase [Oceanobacillus halophilus]RKQ30504.1 alanine racemase [Oceanobacillus halophilus]